MPGQCYACGTEFSFFKKEHGCKNCGFAFCSKCLTKKATVPKENLRDPKDKEGVYHVCNKCHDILTGKTKVEKREEYDLPEAYLKRMAALQQREAQGTQSHHSAGVAGGGNVKVNPKFAGLSKEDREIAERLEKLKEKPQGPKTTDKEINERLARLKGEDPAVRTAPAKPVYQPPDRRTQTEEIDDLLEEIANEVEIDSHQPDPATYVQDRLSRLRENKTGKKTKEEEEQNNLDKNNLSSPKDFVKNVDVGQPKLQNTATNSSQQATGGEDVDIGEVHALMARAADQMEVEAQRALEGMKKDKELMDRLSQIKQKQKDKDADSQSGAQSNSSNVDNALEEEDDSEDEEVAAKRIMQRFMEEVKLDERLGADLDADSTANAETASATGKSSKSKPKAEKTKASGEMTNEKGDKQAKESEVDDDDYEDPNELPFCIICTEDAVVRCIDCDMDLYCNRCFRDGHKELGFTDHRSVPYKAPKGYRTG